MNAIFKRRSIRKYTPETISDDVLKTLLEAGMSAPSAGNEQPWHFVVIKEKAMLAKLVEVSPYAKMTKDAAVAILVCGELELEKHEGFWVQDCSAATENILIAVADLNLGAVWLGIYPREDRVTYLRNLLNIPEHIVPFALIPVGHPAEHKDPGNRYNEGRIHYEQW